MVFTSSVKSKNEFETCRVQSVESVESAYVPHIYIHPGLFSYSTYSTYYILTRRIDRHVASLLLYI